MSTWPEFQRVMVRRREEATIVDLVIDRAPAVEAAPVDFEGIAVHGLREIAANRVCALLGRCELRDLVDLKAILARGHSLEQAMADAVQKDGGVSPATLAWLLEQLRIGQDAAIPGGMSATELDGFRADLVRRLRAMAWPG